MSDEVNDLLIYMGAFLVLFLILVFTNATNHAPVIENVTVSKVTVQSIYTISETNINEYQNEVVGNGNDRGYIQQPAGQRAGADEQDTSK